MNNNVALFHIFPLQSPANPGCSSLRGSGEENKRVNRVERRFSELSSAQSDQEGAIECVRVREKDEGRERQRRWRRSWMCTIGLDMNAPQHSFPHIPFNFKLSNRTSNSLLHPPTPRTEAFLSGARVHVQTDPWDTPPYPWQWILLLSGKKGCDKLLSASFVGLHIGGGV